MERSRFTYGLISAISVLALLFGPVSSWGQQWGQHAHTYYRYHDHPHWGVRVANFYPNEYYPVAVGGVNYYYDDGIYYDYSGGGYVVIQPPIGAVVSAIPPDFHAVVINGMTYYADNGVYYVYTPRGYRVVPAPR